MEQPEPHSWFIVLSSFLRHSSHPKALRFSPAAGTNSLNPPSSQSSSGLLEPSGVAAQRWLSASLCPGHPHIRVKPGTEMPLIEIRCQTRHKQKQRAAVKADTENSSKNIFLEGSGSSTSAFCHRKVILDMIMNPLRFFSSTGEKCAEQQKQQSHTLACGLWPNRNLNRRWKIYHWAFELKLSSLLRNRTDPQQRSPTLLGTR